MSAELITIVIPCFNQAQFLRESIESARSQTHSSIEIIVVDDGSADNTAQVASHYPDVKLVRQANMGLAAARNSGINASSGNYLVFLDADDYLEPNALAAGLDCLLKHPECAFAWGRYRIRDRHGEVSEPGPKRDKHADAYARLLRGNHIVMHATVIYRREPLNLVGGFDTRLPACEDYDLYLRIARRFPISSHDKIVAEYRRHGNNMSLDSPMMLAAALRALKGQRAYVDENPDYKVAYASGMGFWIRVYGVPCLRKIARELFEFRFADARGDAASFFRAAGASTVLLISPVWIVREFISSRCWKRSR